MRRSNRVRDTVDYNERSYFERMLGDSPDDEQSSLQRPPRESSEDSHASRFELSATDQDSSDVMVLMGISEDEQALDDRESAHPADRVSQDERLSEDAESKASEREAASVSTEDTDNPHDVASIGTASDRTNDLDEDGSTDDISPDVTADLIGGYGATFPIMLSNGLTIHASDLAAGDRVLGADGRAHKVLRVESVREKLYELKVRIGRSIKEEPSGLVLKDDPTWPDLVHALDEEAIHASATSVILLKVGEDRKERTVIHKLPSGRGHPVTDIDWDNDTLSSTNPWAGITVSGAFKGFSKALVQYVQLERDGLLTERMERELFAYSFITGRLIPSFAEHDVNPATLDDRIDSIWPKCIGRAKREKWRLIRHNELDLELPAATATVKYINNYDFTTFPQYQGGDPLQELASQTAVRAVVDQISNFLELHILRKDIEIKHQRATSGPVGSRALHGMTVSPKSNKFSNLTFKYAHGSLNNPRQVNTEFTKREKIDFEVPVNRHHECLVKKSRLFEKDSAVRKAQVVHIPDPLLTFAEVIRKAFQTARENGLVYEGPTIGEEDMAWLFGLWIADGDASDCKIAVGRNDFNDLLPELKRLAPQMGLCVRTPDPATTHEGAMYAQGKINSIKAQLGTVFEVESHGTARRRNNKQINVFWQVLLQLGVTGNKQISPETSAIIRAASPDTRRAFLGGAIAGDGCVIRSRGSAQFIEWSFVQSAEPVYNDGTTHESISLLFRDVARSLGFATRALGNYGRQDDSFRWPGIRSRVCSITGHGSELIDPRISHKRFNGRIGGRNARRPVKISSVVESPFEETAYQFLLEGNGRFYHAKHLTIWQDSRATAASSL